MRLADRVAAADPDRLGSALRALLLVAAAGSAAALLGPRLRALPPAWALPAAAAAAVTALAVEALALAPFARARPAALDLAFLRVLLSTAAHGAVSFALLGDAARWGTAPGRDGWVLLGELVLATAHCWLSLHAWKAVAARW